MAIKTNKSYAKRVKLTKSGKMLLRRPGVNHFLAKKSRVSQLAKRKRLTYVMGKKARQRFLVNL